MSPPCACIIYHVQERKVNMLYQKNLFSYYILCWSSIPRITLEAEKAVSVAEKKAESAMQMIRATHKPMKAFNPFDYTP